MEVIIKPAVLMAAIALYEALGVLESLAYLQKKGFLFRDAVDLLAAYDDAKQLLKLCKGGTNHGDLH